MPAALGARIRIPTRLARRDIFKPQSTSAFRPIPGTRYERISFRTSRIFRRNIKACYSAILWESSQHKPAVLHRQPSQPESQRNKLAYSLSINKMVHVETSVEIAASPERVREVVCTCNTLHDFHAIPDKEMPSFSTFPNCQNGIPSSNPSNL